MEKKDENGNGNGLNNFNFSPSCERVFPNSFMADNFQPPATLVMADNFQPPATLFSLSPEVVPPPARRFFEVPETFANPIDFNHLGYVRRGQSPSNNFGNYYTDILQRLQRLRMRGQMPDLNQTSPSELMRSLLAGSNRSPIINNGMQRNGLWSSNSNPNGFQSPYDSVNGFGRTDPRWSNINVFESENLMSSSLNNNHKNNLFRARSPPALVRGRLFWMAKDQHGCPLLQQKLEEGNPEEIQMIFSELKDHVLELMVDQFGNYVAHKLFKFCNAQQITQMIVSSISNNGLKLMAACDHEHGTRAMQTWLEHLTTGEQRKLVLSVLRQITHPLSKSHRGHHVVQKCFRLFSQEENKHLLNAVADNFLDLATDKSGCCVIQSALENAQGEIRERLLAEITANALVLSEHAYGNYVVQNVMGSGTPPHVIAAILAQLVGSYVALSMNKYGSNVVEKCLKEMRIQRSTIIIKEIIYSPNFLMVLQDPFGNYVAQTAFNVVKGTLREEMVRLIQELYPFLHSHPHGKRVLEVLRRTRGRRPRV